MTEAADPQLQAFRRLLAEGNLQGGTARSDALAALCLRRVWVPLWSEDGAFRTLVNSNGESALPVFTAPDALERAAQRFGWSVAGQSSPVRTVDGREALQHALGRGLQYVVVDIAEDHALEIEHAELPRILAEAADRLRTAERIPPTPPSDPPPRREDHFAHRDARHVSSAPPPEPSPRTPPNLADPAPTAATGPSGTGEPASSTAADSAGPASATFGGGAQVIVQAWPEPPADDLVKALERVFREYPEVEWASLVVAARGPTSPRPAVAIRVTPDYRARLNEILQKTRAAADEAGTQLDTLVVDEQSLVRRIRAIGAAIYPWRSRKATRPGT